MTKEKTYLVFFTFFAVVVGFAIMNGGYIKKDNSCGVYEKQDIYIGNKNIIVEMADNDCKRILGLSGRREIKEGDGMLFIFDDETNHGIWMKDMNFPIDITWVNLDQEVVLTEENISPETYPEVFGKNLVSKFVIELPSGFIEENNIKIGDRITINN